jgi:hypothetical protein
MRRYVNEGFGEGGEDTGESLDESDFKFVRDFYVNTIRSIVVLPGNHFSRSSLKKSCNSAANSIPVGPPPTTTMCNNLWISSGV